MKRLLRDIVPTLDSFGSALSNLADLYALVLIVAFVWASTSGLVLRILRHRGAFRRALVAFYRYLWLSWRGRFSAVVLTAVVLLPIVASPIVAWKWEQDRIAQAIYNSHDSDLGLEVSIAPVQTRVHAGDRLSLVASVHNVSQVNRTRVSIYISVPNFTTINLDSASWWTSWMSSDDAIPALLIDAPYDDRPIYFAYFDNVDVGTGRSLAFDLIVSESASPGSDLSVTTDV